MALASAEAPLHLAFADVEALLLPLVQQKLQVRAEARRPRLPAHTALPRALRHCPRAGAWRRRGRGGAAAGRAVGCRPGARQCQQRQRLSSLSGVMQPFRVMLLLCVGPDDGEPAQAH